MTSHIRPLLGLVLLGIIVGFTLGLVTGLFVVPVTYYDSEIAQLHSAQKEDWVFMTGAAFAVDGNLSDAMQRINRLDADPEAAVQYVADVALRAMDRKDTRNAKNVVSLALALGVGTPAMRSYLQSEGAPAPTRRP